MGHTTVGALNGCLHKCQHTPNVPKTVLVVGVRNPYFFWKSRYQYAWMGAQCASGQCGEVHDSLASSLGELQLTPADLRNTTLRRNPLRNFSHFMHWIGSEQWLPPLGHTTLNYAQPAQLARVCGVPCDADFILHTERLAQDWMNLLLTLGLPLVQMPEINKVGANMEKPPPAPFTPDVIEVIQRVDASIFTNYNYPHQIPSELLHLKYPPLSPSLSPPLPVVA